MSCMNYKTIPLQIFTVSTILFACNKSKLNEPGLGSLDEPAIANKKGVEGLLIGAYSRLDGISGGDLSYGAAGSNWIYGSVCGSEAYTGGKDKTDQADIISLEIFKPTAYNSDLAEKWASVYDGVARTDEVLRVMRKATDMSATDTTEVRAEAVFLRAFYHFEAKKIWNDIPFVDESITIDANNFHVPNDTTWSHIEDDLSYAVINLPVMQTAAGRANKYAAKALLAKAYMFEHKYVLAQPLLNDLIQNGETSSGVKYALYKKFHDNFNPAYKNGSESVFAAQISVNDGASPENGNLGDFLNYPSNLSYNFFQPSQYLVNHFKTDPVTGLPDLNTFNNIDVKNDEGLKSSDPFTPDTISLDPRLDWTVGRRGIPYLDWGIHPGADWMYNGSQSFGGPYSPKKNSIAKSESQEYTDNGWSGGKANSNNINFIRFADVLLWAAEVEVEIGSLDKAEEYVNMIRNRAANPDGWVHTYVDDNNPSKGFTNTSAANYKISTYPNGYFQLKGKDYARKAIRYERMLELGMEGHRFFDLVRWVIADTEINTYLEKEKTLRDYLNDAKFTENKNEYFPIPQTQIDLSAGANGVPVMIQNPGY